MRELIERMEGFTEAKEEKRYRVTVLHKDWDKENMERYGYEFHTEKFGWRKLKNVNRKLVLSKMVAKNQKLIGKEIDEKEADKYSKKVK